MTSIVSHVKSTLYPDNYLSIGFAPRKGKVKQQDREYEHDYESQFDAYSIVDRNINGDVWTTHRFFSGGYEDSYKLDKCPKLSQTSRRYGQKGISVAGKRKLKAGAALLQRNFGKGRLGFATLTLPNFTAPKLRYLAENWGSISRVFYQKLKRLHEKLGVPQFIVGCTEIQPNRYKERGEICPHLHYIYVAKPHKDASYYYNTDQMRELWNSVVLHFIHKGFPVTGKAAFMLASCKLEPIKKCISRYLGKYISKGGEIVDNIVEEGRGAELPRQWWTMSKPMKVLYESSLRSIDPDLAWEMFSNPEAFLQAGVFSWYSMIEVEVNGIYRTVGLSAVLADDSYREGMIENSP